MKASISIPTLTVCAALLFGCESTYKELDADPLPPTSFLPNHQLLVLQNPKFPFQRMWYKKDYDWSHFKKIKFDAIDTSHMLADSWWQNVNEANCKSMKQQAEQIAQYMRNAFIRDIIEDPLRSFAVTDTVDADTAVVKLALVQLVPTKAFFNAVTTTAGLLIPGASLLSMGDAGCVAMECKVVDGKTGEVVMMLADREKDQTVMISASNYTWYGHSKAIIDQWAASFAEMATKRNAKYITPKEFPISIINL